MLTGVITANLRTQYGFLSKGDPLTSVIDIPVDAVNTEFFSSIVFFWPMIYKMMIFTQIGATLFFFFTLQGKLNFEFRTLLDRSRYLLPLACITGFIFGIGL